MCRRVARHSSRPSTSACTFAARSSRAAAQGALPLEAVAGYYLGQAHHALGDYRRAIDFLRRTVAILTGDLLHERFGQWTHPSVASRDWMVRCLAARGG